MDDGVRFDIVAADQNDRSARRKSEIIGGAFEIANVEVVERSSHSRERERVADVKLSVKNISPAAIKIGILSWNERTRYWYFLGRCSGHIQLYNMWNGGTVIESGAVHSFEFDRVKYNHTMKMDGFQLGEFHENPDGFSSPTKVFLVPGRIRKPLLGAWKFDKN